MERRRENRCPVCQGRMILGMNSEDKCRNSLCIFNHRKVTCPRCGENKILEVEYENMIYSYTCGECLNRWKIQSSLDN